MRIPSISCWALGFLSLYSLHRYCMRSRIISRPTASFPWRPAVKRNSGSPAETTVQDCSYLPLNHNLLTSTWCLLRFTGIIVGAIKTQQSSGFHFNQSAFHAVGVFERSLPILRLLGMKTLLQDFTVQVFLQVIRHILDHSRLVQEELY